MVVEHEGQKRIIAIPWIKRTVSDDRQRPQQALLPACVPTRDIRRRFYCFTLTRRIVHFWTDYLHKRGFFILPYEPSQFVQTCWWSSNRNELETFKGWSLIGSDVYAKMSSRLAQMKITTDVRVMIIQDEFRGSIGKVMEVAENKVVIFLEPMIVANIQLEHPRHWLQHDKLKNTRMKLFLRGSPNDELEFKGIVGDQSKIRDHSSSTRRSVRCAIYSRGWSSHPINGSNSRGCIEGQRGSRRGLCSLWTRQGSEKEGSWSNLKQFIFYFVVQEISIWQRATEMKKVSTKAMASAHDFT